MIARLFLGVPAAFDAVSSQFLFRLQLAAGTTRPCENKPDRRHDNRLPRRFRLCLSTYSVGAPMLISLRTHSGFASGFRLFPVFATIPTIQRHHAEFAVLACRRHRSRFLQRLAW